MAKEAVLSARQASRQKEFCKQLRLHCCGFLHVLDYPAKCLNQPRLFVVIYFEI